jgi:hypothetical protein
MCEQHMKRSVTKITKRPQGKKDQASKWAQNRDRWVIGAYVPGLAGGRVPGHRHTATTQKTSGKRTCLEYDPTVLEETFHEDLIAILSESHGTTSKFRLIEKCHNELDELFGE